MRKNKKNKNEWKDFYQILNCQMADTTQTIQYAYYRLVAQYSVLTDTNQKKHALYELQLAFSTLTNPNLREKYDETYLDELAKMNKRMHAKKRKINIINAIKATVSRWMQKLIPETLNHKNTPVDDKTELKKRIIEKRDHFNKEIEKVEAMLSDYNYMLKEDTLTKKRFADKRNKILAEVKRLLSGIEEAMQFTYQSGFKNDLFIPLKDRLSKIKEEFPKTYAAAIWGNKKEEEREEIHNLVLAAPNGIKKAFEKIAYILTKASQQEISEEEYKLEMGLVLAELKQYKEAIKTGLIVAKESNTSKAERILKELLARTSVHEEELKQPFFAAQCGIVKQKEDLDKARERLEAYEKELRYLEENNSPISEILELRLKKIGEYIMICELEQYIIDMKQATSVDMQKQIYGLAILQGLELEIQELSKEIDFYTPLKEQPEVQAYINKCANIIKKNKNNIEALKTQLGIPSEGTNLAL